MPNTMDEDDRAQRYDPAVVAAIARDEITLTEIARTVDLPYQHARDWATIGTPASDRRFAYRALEDWAAGRSIAKPDPARPSQWILEPVRQDVSMVELAALKRRVDDAVASLADVSASLTVTPPRSNEVTPSGPRSYEKSDPDPEKERDLPLTGQSDLFNLGLMLNPNIIRFASEDFEKSIDGVKMDNISIKLPKGFKEEFSQVAAEYGLTWAQLMRALAHLLRKGRAAAG